MYWLLRNLFHPPSNGKLKAHEWKKKFIIIVVSIVKLQNEASSNGLALEFSWSWPAQTWYRMRAAFAIMASPKPISLRAWSKLCYCNIEPSRIPLFERLITNNHKIFFLPPPVMVYCSQIDLIPWASLQVWTISSWKSLLNVLYRKKKNTGFLGF